MMLETLFTAAGGGLFGILGGLVKTGLDMWHAAKKAEADLALMLEGHRHEKEMLVLEIGHATELAQIGAAKEVDVAAYSSLQSALSADHASYATGDAAKNSAWFIAVDVVRGLIRPVLTLFFSIAVTILAYWVWVQVPAATISDPTFLTATFYKLVDALIFLATTSAGFWFGSRYTGKK